MAKVYGVVTEIVLRLGLHGLDLRNLILVDDSEEVEGSL